MCRGAPRCEVAEVRLWDEAGARRLDGGKEVQVAAVERSLLLDKPPADLFEKRVRRLNFETTAERRCETLAIRAAVPRVRAPMAAAPWALGLARAALVAAPTVREPRRFGLRNRAAAALVAAGDSVSVQLKPFHGRAWV